MNGPEDRRFQTRLRLSLGVLLLAFSSPLLNLTAFAFQSDLYSHTLLIPFVSLYLIWPKRKNLRPSSPLHRSVGAFLVGLGAVMAAGYWIAVMAGVIFSNQDYLACMIFSFVSGAIGLCGLFFGNETLRIFRFPLGLLVFIAPLPVFFEHAINTILQQASAGTALILFKLFGTPVFYDNLVFKLPGIVLEVAPECSGIHSSLVLLITSLLAGFLFLRSPSRCIILALATFPLAILRNGVRIVTIGELCVRIGPDMIDSDIHRKGGPLFFALSLIPFSVFLWWLWRADRGELKSGAVKV